MNRHYTDAELNAMSNEELARIAGITLKPTRKYTQKELEGMSDEELAKIAGVQLKRPKTTTQKILGVAQEVLDPAAALASSAAHGGIEAATNVANLPADIYQSITGRTPYHLKAYQPEPARLQKEFPRLSSVGDVVGQIGALIGGGASTEAPKALSALSRNVGKIAPKSVQPILKGALGGLIGGGAVTPGSLRERLESGAEAALVGAGLGSAVQASRLLKKGINVLSGAHSKQSALEKFKSLLGDTPVDNINQEIGDEVRNNYLAHKAIADQNYSEFNDMARRKGYTDKAQPNLITGYKPKAIRKKPIMDIAKKLDSKYHTSEVSNAIDNFEKNPSFNNAFHLQSELGKNASSLKTSAEPMKAFDYSKARNTLKKEIKNSFKRNGDAELIPEFDRISEHYKEHVVPYEGEKWLKGWLNERKDIPNFLNRLKGTKLKEVDGEWVPEEVDDKDYVNINKIREDLSEKGMKLLLSDALKGATFDEPGVGLEVNPKSLITNYGKLRNRGLQDLKNKEFEQSLHQLRQELNKKEMAKKAVWRGIGPTIGIYAGGHALMHTLRDLLGV